MNKVCFDEAYNVDSLTLTYSFLLGIFIAHMFRSFRYTKTRIKNGLEHISKTEG